MPRFIAIPVAQGDAFYLDRGNWSVLVDGGRARSAFGAVFQATTRADGVSVAVCTHNDADHANGIMGFLESGLRCNEVWLPGQWLNTLPYVLKPFIEVFVTLADDVAQAEVFEVDQPGEHVSPLERFAEQVHDRLKHGHLDEDVSPLVEDGWPEKDIQLIEQAKPWEEGPWAWHPDEWPGPFFPRPRYWALDRQRVQLLWSAIDAARRIRSIATEAFHRGITVRWFEHNTTHPSGPVRNAEPRGYASAMM